MSGTQSGSDRLLAAVAQQAQLEELELAGADIGDAAFGELSDEELEALAGRIASQLPNEPSGEVHRLERAPTQRTSRDVGVRPGRDVGVRRWAWLAAAAVLGASLALTFGKVPTVRSPIAERTTAAIEDTPAAIEERHVALPDGSTLVLTGDSQAQVAAVTPSEVRVRLERGSVTCEVAPNPERRFVVAAGAFEVVVKGTRFTVSTGENAAPGSGALGSAAPGSAALGSAAPGSAAPGSAAPGSVAVSVERGLVEVREPPDRVLALLGAGQRWASDASARPEPDAGATAASTPAPMLAFRRASPYARSAPPRAPAPLGPRQLFEQANAAQLAGRASEAAAAFDELRLRHPTDTRAGYAAFMLGRIRLNSLDDANGAVEAFTFALAHPGGGFFLEDAEARRVEALAKAGRRVECRQARDRFLASHPGAVRAALVAKQCDAP